MALRVYYIRDPRRLIVKEITQSGNQDYRGKSVRPDGCAG